MTNILVNTDWWSSLDAETQQIFEEAALEAARNERDLSVADGQKSLETLKDRGVEVIELTSAEKQALKAQSAWIYSKYDDSYFEPGLIESIQKH
jgi:C4-dicarboxylate-binding protein DctP